MRFLKKLRNYIVYDLKEILNPSSLPDPPWYRPPRKLTFRDWIKILREASLDYVDSWRKHPRRPVHVGFREKRVRKRAQVEGDDRNLLQEFGKLLKDEKRDIRVVLQKLYYSRGKVLSRAIRSFADGFHEGLKEVKNPSKQN